MSFLSAFFTKNIAAIGGVLVVAVATFCLNDTYSLPFPAQVQTLTKNTHEREGPFVTTEKSIISQENWEALVRKSADRPEFSLLNIQVEGAYVGKGSPLGAHYSNGHCLVKVDLSKEGGLSVAQWIGQSVNPAYLPALVQVMAVHEFAHCKRQQQQNYSMTALLKTRALAQVSPDGGTLLKSEYLSRKEEGFADLAALLFARKNFSEEFSELLIAFVTLRKVSGYTHAVAPVLDHFSAKSFPVTWDYFETAENLLEKAESENLLY